MHTFDDDTLQRYAELLREFRRHLLNFCYRHSANAVEADQLLVAISNTLLRSVGILRTDATARQRNRWMKRVMQGALADYRRSTLRTVSLREPDSLAVETDEEAELVEALLEHLDADDRDFLRERFAGYRPAEQAARRGVSVDVVNHRYHRIVIKLRTIYKKYYE